MKMNLDRIPAEPQDVSQPDSEKRGFAAAVPFFFEKEYEAARDILAEGEVPIEEFVGKKDAGGMEYTARAVATDRETIAKIKQTFENEAEAKKVARKLSLILEAMFYQFTELGNWLGQEGSTILPSEYDDIMNGVDAIFKLKEGDGEGDQYLGVAIDVTFGSMNPEINQTIINKKIDRVRDSIESGKLTRVKYFKAEKDDEYDYTSLENIPRVVIGCDRRAVEELVGVWKKLNEARKRPDNEENSKLRRNLFGLIQNHPIQFQILLEMKMQLEYFAQYAAEHGKKDLAKEFEKRLAPIDHLLSATRLKEEGKVMPDKSAFTRDKVYEEISNAVAGSMVI
jgi:hypothetical protein